MDRMTAPLELRARVRSHPHPTPGPGAGGGDAPRRVLVVGGGHAGVEAALAAARVGCEAWLVSFRADRIGEMSCNPAIGGLGKGQLAREVDALGGAMGLAIDRSGIQFRMLNTAKGFAVRAPRAQADRHRYREEITSEVEAAAGVRIVEGAVARLIVSERDGRSRVDGVELEDGRELRAAATILTTGTFLAAIMHTGEAQAAGGRVGEATVSGLSADLRRLGLRTGRLKTGTPPRLASDSIDWDRLEPQFGDSDPEPFSFRTRRADFPSLEQIACHITHTNPRTHALIAANIHRAPMYTGAIEGVGPRYCPSVEDKVMRFADRDRHQLFLEPESLGTDVVYVNGISTSLPADVQEEFVRTVEGLERACFLRHGYAVEYDFCEPSQLDPTLAVAEVPGLYLAGQINGTSGYEEAAAQGLLAGANAALWIQDREPFVLERHEAYAGVLVDDLIVTNPTEPYRMFTSRAEYRLLLRQDNADRRLVPRAAAVGLVSEQDVQRTEARGRRLAAAHELLRTLRDPARDHRTLEECLRRPDLSARDLLASRPELAALELEPDLITALEADVKYAGYVERQVRDVERLERQERTEIPHELDPATIVGLRGEALETLIASKPRTLGQASRLAGIQPPDVALLAVHVERLRRGSKNS